MKLEIGSIGVWLDQCTNLFNQMFKLLDAFFSHKNKKLK